MIIFVVVLLAVLWILRVFEIRLAQKNKKPGRVSKRSRFTLLIMMLAGLMVNAVIIVELFTVRREIVVIVSTCGLAMLLLRAGLKCWCVKTLREFWSAEIEIREEHQLIRNGPYKYLRHPAYLANIIEALSYAVIANAYFALLVALFVFVPTVLIRIHFEEKELVDVFGNEYIEFQARSWTLIPFKPFLVDIISGRG